MPAVAFIVVYCVLLLCLPARLIFGPLGAPGTPANLLGIGALVWWIGATLTGQNPVRGWTPIRAAVAVFTGSVLLSYANGMARGWWAPLDVRERTADVWTLSVPTVGDATTAIMSAADRGLLACAGWIGITLIVSEGLRSWRDLELLASWLTWLAAFVATLGIVQFWTGYDIAGLFRIPGLVANSDFGGVDGRSVLNRVSATATHAIEYGVVLGALLALALHHALHHRGTRLSWLPAVIIFLGCSLSVSRSAVLVAGTAFVILLVGWPAQRRRRALLLAPVAVVALRVMVPGLVGTLISLFTNLFNDDSVTGRTGDYDIVFRVYADHPYLGRGLFTFLPRYYRVLDNQYLLILLELGVVGLLAALLFYVTGYGCARRVKRDALDERSRHLGLALSASIAGLMVSLVTYDAWSYGMATGVTVLLIGMAGAARRLTVEEHPRTPVVEPRQEQPEVVAA